MLTTTMHGARHLPVGTLIDVDAKEPIARDWQGVHACAALSKLARGRFECVHAQRWACEPGDDRGECLQEVPCQRPPTSFEPDPKQLATARAQCKRVTPP